MVKEAAVSGGFVISLNQSTNDQACADWGAWVEIIDFEQLPDGLLGLTVEAKSLVALSDFYYEDDDLLNATITQIPHWAETSEPAATEKLQLAYRELLDEQPQLSSLYPSLEEATEAQWVVSRWLEILPLTFNCRKKLTEINSFELALNTVETIVLGK